jgi:hypothetical protein
VNVSALEGPVAVVTITCAEGAVDGGTVTVQVFWAGQRVVATCPLKVASI